MNNTSTALGLDISGLLTEVRDEIRGLRKDVQDMAIGHQALTGRIDGTDQHLNRLQSDFDNHLSNTAQFAERLTRTETVQAESNRNIDNNKKSAQLMISGILVIIALITLYLKH